MQENNVKRKIFAGGTAIGTMMFEFNSTGIARVAAVAGAEFALFDMEHSGWGIDTIRTLLATAHADIVPMVRIPTLQYQYVSRVLDMGALGVMVPMVETEEQARSLVQFAKYPPQGRRGTAFGIAHDDYRPGDNLQKMQQANQEILLIAQIETATGLENVEAIAAVEGIDVLWIGHNDLTTSMGIPGEFSHPRYLEALQKVLAAAQAHGKVAGFMAPNVSWGKQLLEQGFRILAYGGDVWLYQQALRDGIAALRERG